MTIANRRRPQGHAHHVNPLDRAMDLVAKSQVQTPLSQEPSNNVVQRVQAISSDLFITPAGQLVSQYNPRRASLLIQNKSGLTVFVNFGAAANAGDQGKGFKIDPGGFIEPNSVPVDAIYAWTPVGNAAITFLEGNQ